MQINWPDNLVEELAYRRCILFTGAGISATAKNEEGESPKDWKGFIQEAISLLRDESQEKLDFINEKLEQGNFLLALQTIVDSCDPGQYANFLKQKFSRPNYRASKVHEYIKAIDAKVDITTNIDKIYENICNEHGYIVANYSETKKILTNLKSTENLIIKAHGSIDDVDGLVFTQRQYYNAKKKHSDFYKILHALFLTNTVLFLGYSLNDPDINLILELVANSASSSSPHYIVVKQGVNEELKKYWLDCYNIYTLEYGPDYEDLESNILNLNDRVWEYRQRKRIP